MKNSGLRKRLYALVLALLGLAGQLNASNAEISIPVTCQNDVLPGFNLVGNPYTNNISISSVTFNGTPFTSYYKVVNGNQLIVFTGANPILPAEGFMVQVPTDGTLTFNAPARQEQGSYVQLMLCQGGPSTSLGTAILDRAYLSMDGGVALNKAIMAGHPSLLYIVSEGQPLAVAPHAQAYNLCFEATESGTFTLETGLFDTHCDYLHLIDRLTGQDIDLSAFRQAQRPASYTFEASPTDRVDRFVLVLAEGAQPEAIDINRTRDLVPILPSHGSGNNEPAYEQTSYDITATAEPSEGGTVTGFGTFEQGQSCTLTATANEGYAFVNWTEDGEEASTDSIYSFVVTGERNLVANFVASQEGQTVELSEGWSWWSTNLDITLNDLKNAIADAVGNTGTATIKTQDGAITYRNGHWRGNGIQSLDIRRMYEIQTSVTCEITLVGTPVNPSEYEITITPDNNWIGFLSGTSMTLSEAFGTFPVDGDVVTSQNLSSVYHNGQWRGQLRTLQPGHGYIYQSYATGERTFVFPSSAK